MINTMSNIGMTGEVDNSGTIGERYGAVVKKHDIIRKILKQLEENPWNRRNVISLWDYEAFENTDGLLPCAFQTMYDVRRVGEIYLDATLTQRSNDMLVSHHINAMQYVALQMMIAKHFGWKVGKFFYFVNFIIHDNQFEQSSSALMNLRIVNHVWYLTRQTEQISILNQKILN